MDQARRAWERRGDELRSLFGRRPPERNTSAEAAWRLRAIRTSMREVVLRAVSAREGSLAVPRVALYVLVGQDGMDQATAFAALQQFADAAGWSSAGQFHDTLPPAPLASHRPGWMACRRHCTIGHADGVLTVSQGHINSDDDLYEDELRDLAARSVFVALLRSETAANFTSQDWA